MGTLGEFEKKSVAPPLLLALPTDWVLGETVGVWMSITLWPSSCMESNRKSCMFFICVLLVKILTFITWGKNMTSLFHLKKECAAKLPYLHSPFLSIHCALLYVMGWRPGRQFISLHCRINAQAYSTLTTRWSTKRLDVWISSQFTHILGGFFPKTPIKLNSLFFCTQSLCAVIMHHFHTL